MYYIIFNPTAGAGRSKKVMHIIETVLHQKCIQFHVVETKYPKHAAELARAAIGKGYKGILSVGGDGTLLEVAGELYGTDEKLGIIPAGTGNDFRRVVCVSKDPVEALDAILNGHSKKVDIGLLNHQIPFLNVAGAGFDVDVINNLERVKKRFTGGLAYFLAIVLSIFKHRSVNLTITVNGQTLQRSALLIAVANGKCFGGGLTVAPDADVEDGLFDVLIINRVPKWRILAELPKLKKGLIDKISVAEQFRCASIHIACDMPLHFELDGDKIGAAPAVLSVIPRSLHVFCPQLN